MSDTFPHNTVLLVLRMPTGRGDGGVITESMMEWTEPVSLEPFTKQHVGGSTVVYLVAERSLKDDAAARALLAQQAEALRDFASHIETHFLAEPPLESAS